MLFLKWSKRPPSITWTWKQKTKYLVSSKKIRIRLLPYLPIIRIPMSDATRARVPIYFYTLVWISLQLTAYGVIWLVLGPTDQILNAKPNSTNAAKSQSFQRTGNNIKNCLSSLLQAIRDDDAILLLDKTLVKKSQMLPKE